MIIISPDGYAFSYEIILLMPWKCWFFFYCWSGYGSYGWSKQLIWYSFHPFIIICNFPCLSIFLDHCPLSLNSRFIDQLSFILYVLEWAIFWECYVVFLGSNNLPNIFVYVAENKMAWGLLQSWLRHCLPPRLKIRA